MWRTLHPALLVVVFCLFPGSSLLLAQAYNSSMNSAQRARESSRYEAALLEGTYNNPMNSPGMNVGAE